MNARNLIGKECFLFDFDGTLVDSNLLHEAAFRHVLSVHRKDLLDGFDYEMHKGRSTLEVFLRLPTINDGEAKKFASLKQAEYRRLAATHLALLPGAREILLYLAAAGKRLFLVTGGSTASVQQGLVAVGIRDIFEGIVTADDVRRSKPDPESYRLCIERHSLSALSSVAIEDAANGVVAARDAGMDVIGVHNAALASLADMFFNDLVTLHKALELDLVA